MDILTLVFLVAGFVLVLYGASLLVKGASRLALAIGISPLVVGLTIVAYGTSSPEFAVSVQAALAQQDDISLGNIIGSNITNVFLVLGLAATFRALSVSRPALRVDGPVMIAASLMLYFLARDSRITQIDGLILTVCGIAYTWITIHLSRRHQKAQNENTTAAGAENNRRMRNIALVITGLVMLVVGAYALIESSVQIASYLGLSNIVIGLTVIAIGTSLPEIATSLVAGIKGEHDIAIGNAVGSNIMNIFMIIGIASLVTPGGMGVTDVVITTDLPVMIGAAVLCLAVMYSGYSIQRWEGILFLLFFTGYMAFVVIRTSNAELMPRISTVFFYALLPLTATTVGIGVVRTFLGQKKRDAESAP